MRGLPLQPDSKKMIKIVQQFSAENRGGGVFTVSSGGLHSTVCPPLWTWVASDLETKKFWYPFSERKRELFPKMYFLFRTHKIMELFPEISFPNLRKTTRLFCCPNLHATLTNVSCVEGPLCKNLISKSGSSLR